MEKILEKLHKLGWEHRIIENSSITLKKQGKKRIGVIKIDLVNNTFKCYNLDTSFLYERTELRELTLTELVLVYKLLKENKDENKNKHKTE